MNQDFNRAENALNRGFNSNFAHAQVVLTSGQLGTVLTLKGIPASLSRHRLYVRCNLDFAIGDVAVGSVKLLLNNRIVLELPICGGIADGSTTHSLSILQAPQAGTSDPSENSMFIGQGNQSMRAIAPFNLRLLFDAVQVEISRLSFSGSASLHVGVFSEP